MAWGRPVIDRPAVAGDAGYIATLDGWRAVAIALVIGSHCVPMLHNSHSRLAQYPITLFNHAGYGVDVFFALSGFLITTLMLREKDRRATISLPRFYIRRACRILPPILVYMAVLAALSTLNILPSVTGRELMSSILFARNYTDGSWYTGHFWSLSIEEHFYLVMPVLVLLLPRPTLMKVCLGLVVVCVLIRAFELSNASAFQPLPQFRSENRFDALLWGSILAQYSSRQTLADLRTKMRPAFMLAWLLAIAGLLLAFDDPSLRRTVTAIGIPPLVLYTVANPGGWVGRVLELRTVRFVGRISYSLYVWQMMFLVPGDRPLGVVQSFPLSLIIPMVLAVASYNWVEKPLIAVGHRLSRRIAAQERPVHAA